MKTEQPSTMPANQPKDYRPLNFENLQSHRHTLTAFIEQLLEIFQSLNMTGWVQTAHVLEQRVRSDTFKVLILGEFRRGKSTFINALLHEDVLPAYPIPTTGIINEVKWGETRKALLHYKKAADGSSPPPREIPIEDLEEYVVIKESYGVDNQAEQQIRESPYDKVEIFWPIDLCRNGVELIDSPGLNEHQVRQKITMDYLSNVDAILFVFSCEAIGSITEIGTIENVLFPAGHRDLFLICNRFDKVRVEEREMVKRHGIAKLSAYTERGANRIFFISAWDALEGRLKNDTERLEQSGIVPLEAEIEEFLAKEKGRVKIIRPAFELKTAIKDLKRSIMERRAMLRTDLETLEKRYAQAQSTLQQLEQDRQMIVGWVANLREDLKVPVIEKANAFYEDVLTKMPGWTEQHVPQTPFEWLSKTSTKQQVVGSIEEVIGHLTDQVASEFATWQASELQPFLLERMEALRSELDAKTASFLGQLDAVRGEIAHGTVEKPAVEPIEEAAVSPMNKILNSIGAPEIGTAKIAGMGSSLGSKELLMTMLPQLGLSFGAAILLVPLPWLAAVALAASLVQAFRQGSVMNTKIKGEASRRYMEHIRTSIPEQSQKIGDIVAQVFGELGAKVDQGLAKQIQDLREQVETVLAEKQSGQAKVDQAVRDLASHGQRVVGIEEKLDDLIREVSLA